MKVWLTVQVESKTRSELKKLAAKKGMKMHALTDALLRDGLAYHASFGLRPDGAGDRVAVGYTPASDIPKEQKS
jgi:hypothetical protein